jgi:acyl carrier protein
MNAPQNALRARIVDVVSRVFGLAPETVVAEGVSPAHVDGWDSEKHVELVVALEEQFEVLFDAEDVPELTSLERMEAVIKRHG